MTRLETQRCFNHPGREAAARCPECRRFYCRECVTEHEDRAICALCLRKLATGTAQRRSPFRLLARVLQVVLGFCAAWLFFYWLGQSLLAVPDTFHEGTVWKSNWWDEP